MTLEELQAEVRTLRQQVVMLQAVQSSVQAKVSIPDPPTIDKDQNVELPDGEHIYVGAPIRNTLERNPLVSSGHFHEWQMYNVDEVTPNTLSLPYFDAADTSPLVAGDLKWAAIDSHNTKASGPQKSLELRDPGAGGNFIAQLYDVDAPSAFTPVEADDLFVMRDKNGPTVAYMTFAQLKTIMDAYYTLTGHTHSYTQITGFEHANLTDIVADAYSVDDHDSRYWWDYGAGHHVDAKHFRTTGEVQADTFTIQDSTPNTWNAAGFTADVTAAIALTADTDITLDAGDDLTLQCADVLAITSISGGVHVSAYTNLGLDAATATMNTKTCRTATITVGDGAGGTLTLDFKNGMLITP